jgi:phosphopentomutase
MLIAGPRVRGARPLGTRSTFSDLGVSICDYLGISNDGFPGRSALEEAGVK